MIRRPNDISTFELAVLSGVRAAQLYRGCSPRVEPSGKIAITAQQEIAERKVQRATTDTPA
jgi:DNA-directed RNA polymerase subunit K/omega